LSGRLPDACLDQIFREARSPRFSFDEMARII